MGQELNNNLAPTKKVSEVLEEAWVYYHLIGMTYNEYWYENTELAKHYRQLDLLRQKRKNQEDWRLGAYIYSAILSASPILNPFAKKGTKPLPYMEQPFPTSEEEVENKNREDKGIKFLNYLHKVAKKGK